MTPQEVSAFNLFCYGKDITINLLPPLTERQQKVYNLASVGWDASNISQRLRIPVNSVYDAICKFKHKGYTL